MKKIAQGIVRLRKLILTVAFLLLIPSAIGAIATDVYKRQLNIRSCRGSIFSTMTFT